MDTSTGWFAPVPHLLVPLTSRQDHTAFRRGMPCDGQDSRALAGTDLI